MKKLYSTDYVILKYGKRVEGLDVIYSIESIVQMVNEGIISLSHYEQFVRMTDLPLVMQKDYLNKLNEQ
tara:strand:+ start:5076 stop:5282 length:207 start_codon:yes stop_codon:yes gene_type:complete